MSDARTAWADVCDRLDALALKLRLHAEQELGEEPDDDVDGTWQRLRDVADDVGDAVERAVADPAVREDLRALLSAMEAAASATADQLRRTIAGASDPAGRR